MSLPVIFRLIHKWEVKINERPDLFQVEIQFEKEVDPDSGMTLNLVEVDALMRQMGHRVQAQSLRHFDELVTSSQVYLLAELKKRAARLMAVEWTLLPSGPVFLWNQKNPEDLSVREGFLARVQVGEAVFRTGPVQILMRSQDHEASQSDFPQVWETKVPSEPEILEKLGSLFPQALEINFQDLKTGESWRRET